MMKVRRFIAVVVCLVAWGAGPIGTASTAGSITFTGTTTCSAEDFNGDPRLGPAVLPDAGPVGEELIRYDRLGGMTAEDFLTTWWDQTLFNGAGGWRFPPFDGFVVGPSGSPVKVPVTMRPGQQIDRYGSEFGRFLAPARLPYAKRALPPQSLDNAQNPAGCNYRHYRVLKAFVTQGGPIAPAFGQPGYGLQYFLDFTLVPGAPPSMNVLWLIDNGYLARAS